MVTTIGTETTLEGLLSDLMSLEHDAIAAYEEAVKRLDGPSLKEGMQGLLSDHQSHLAELDKIMHGMGQNTPSDGAAKKMLTQGKVMAADVIGDKAILNAMKSNEQDTNTAYDRATRMTGIPEDVMAFLQRARDDEARHKAWLEEVIGKI